MTTALTVLENQLKPLAPRLEMVLDKRVPVDRLMQTIMISCERLPLLFDCDRQSLFNSAMSAAVLGLEVDGVTGQAYLIPFAGKAQLVIGYKGFNTLAARSGFTITGAVVREGDEFDYELGSNAYVRHKPKLTGKDARIIGAWACATSKTQPAIVSVLGVDELLAVKAKSPGAKRRDSPWNDPAIGYPAMCEKTAKRRLARSMPLNIMQLAARMDEAVDEQGLAARIDPDRGVIVEGEIVEPSKTPTAEQLISPRPSVDAAGSAASSHETVDKPLESDAADDFSAAHAYVEKWRLICDGCHTAADASQVHGQWSREKEMRELIDWPADGTLSRLRTQVESTIKAARAK
jgi:recombination protein RecT